MKKIYLFWFTPPQSFNFGDELGPYVISKLSGQPIRKVFVLNAGTTILKDIKIMVWGLIRNIYTFKTVFEYIRGKIHKNYIVSIGSILHQDFPKEASIWGAGIIAKDLPINNCNFLAVRGYKTLERIEELGFEKPEQIGDPAILLPLIYQPKKRKTKRRIGIIPHMIHYEEMKSVCNNRGDLLVINLKTKNIEKTIDLITSCDVILSSSLHGLIVPHAYQIPALCIKFGKELSGDGVKFLDYFSSVKIIPYHYLDFYSLDLEQEDKIFDLFADLHLQALPQKEEINKLQIGLLKVAPFNLKEEFKRAD